MTQKPSWKPYLKVVGILKINVRQYVLIVQDCRVLILGEVVVLVAGAVYKNLIIFSPRLFAINSCSKTTSSM